MDKLILDISKFTDVKLHIVKRVCNALTDSFITQIANNANNGKPVNSLYGEVGKRDSSKYLNIYLLRLNKDIETHINSGINETTLISELLDELS